MTFVYPVWTSRQVRTADCYLIVTARRRLSRNRFLSSSVCIYDLAWRRTEQSHRPIRSVGSNRLDQSEVVRTSASTNKKHWANKRLDQSEASGAIASTNRKSCKQAHPPIRSVGRTSALTNHKSFTKQRRSIRRRSTNQISSGREHWRTPRHARRTDFLRTNFVSSDSSSSQTHGSANQIPTSE